MDHEEVGRYWNGNAETWTKLARAGYDVYRDYDKSGNCTLYVCAR